MKKVLKNIYIIFISLLSLWIALECFMFFNGYVWFEEEHNLCLTIPENDEPMLCTSGVLSSSKDLQRYLNDREFYGHLPFEGDIIVDSLDFANFDYIFVEGRSIILLSGLLWDQCSSYDDTGLSPVEIIFGEPMSHKVYIYKIKPKNKYRIECG